MHVCRSPARPNVGSNQLPANIPREGPWATCADYRIPTCETCGETRDPPPLPRTDPIHFSLSFFFFRVAILQLSVSFFFFFFSSTFVVATIKSGER